VLEALVAGSAPCRIHFRRTLASQKRASLIKSNVSVANHLLLPEFPDEQAGRMLLGAAGVN
jgi:hypothetical protein